MITNQSNNRPAKGNETPNVHDDARGQAEARERERRHVQQDERKNEHDHHSTHNQALTDEEREGICREYIEGWKRANADFENFKKRLERERAEWTDRAKEECILELLPVIDNVEAAFASMPSDQEENPWRKGIEYIGKQFQAYLKEQGIEAIPTVGKPFNEQLHEAVEQQHNDSPKPSSKQSNNNEQQYHSHNTPMIIQQEIRRGYLLHGRVVRPARVIVQETI